MKKILINSFLVLCLLVGLALVFNNQLKNLAIKHTGKEYKVAQMTPKDLQKNQKKAGNFDFDSVKSLSSQAVLKDQVSKDELPVIAGIAVPSVGINLPIFKGLSNENLLYGAGTTKENQEMGEGNYGLASHHADRDDLLFTPLTKVKAGEMIYLTDLVHAYSYKITTVQKVAPTDVQWLDDVPNKKLVTLVTCDTIDGINRVIVQGELQASYPLKEAPKEIIQAFELPKRTY